MAALPLKKPLWAISISRQSCKVACTLPSTTSRLHDLISPERDISRPTIMVRRSAWSIHEVFGDESGTLLGSLPDALGRDKSAMRAGIVGETGVRVGFIGIPRSSSFSAISGSLLVLPGGRRSL